MDKTKEIFEQTGRLGNKLVEERKKIEEINLELMYIMDICPHEIVFKYNDDYPRKAVLDGYYFCPACGKTVMCFYKDQVSQSEFKNSRVIPLLSLSLVGNYNVYSTIRQEVYYNMEYYYDKETSTDDLSIRMEDKLKDLQTHYVPTTREIKRIKYKS